MAYAIKFKTESITPELASLVTFKTHLYALHTQAEKVVAGSADFEVEKVSLKERPDLLECEIINDCFPNIDLSKDEYSVYVGFVNMTDADKKRPAAKVDYKKVDGRWKRDLITVYCNGFPPQDQRGMDEEAGKAAYYWFFEKLREAMNK